MGRKKGFSTPLEQREKISSTLRNKHIVRDEEYWIKWKKTRNKNKDKTRDSYVKAAKKRSSNPDYILKLSNSKRGKSFSGASLKNIQEAAKHRRENNPDWYNNIVRANQKIGKDRRGKPNQAAKNWWNNLTDEEKNRHFEKIQESLHLSPNRLEQYLLSILEELFPGEYQFVGDGQVVLGGKCPDFVNINGQKKIIELFGNYWHKESEVALRESHFSKYGYSTLIVWESELQDSEELVSKLQKFHFA